MSAIDPSKVSGSCLKAGITLFTLVSSIAGAPATAQQVRSALYVVTHPRGRALFTLVGHEGMRVDVLPVQHITRVVARGQPEKDGHIYSFSTAYVNFRPDELQSWRLSILGGQLVGGTFQIAGNGSNSITVTNLNGSLDKVAVGDVVMIDSVIVRDIPVRR